MATTGTELVRAQLTGASAQSHTSPGQPAHDAGVLGVAVDPKDIDGTPHTVVQLLLDDDLPGFDPGLLDCPLLAELRTPAGDVVTRELFDHDEFRQRLAAERDAGGDDLRGVVLRTSGALPPPYLRLAFLPTALDGTDGCVLAVVRAGRDELLESIDTAREDGSLSPGEHRGLRTMIEQRHP